MGRDSSPCGKATSAPEERGSAVLMGNDSSVQWLLQDSGSGWVGIPDPRVSLGRRERALVLWILGPSVWEGGQFSSLSGHVLFCAALFLFRVTMRAVCCTWKCLSVCFSAGTEHTTLEHVTCVFPAGDPTDHSRSCA